MPLPVIADVWRVTWNWLVPSFALEFHNVMHFRTAETDGGVVGAKIRDSVLGAMFTDISDTCVVDSMTLVPLDGLSAATEFNIESSDFAGQVDSDFQPQVSQVVRFQTGFSGRKRRGRIYLPAVADSKATYGKIPPGDKDTVEFAWFDFRDALLAGATPIEHVVASYLDETVEPITNYVAPIPLCTQRRRQRQVQRA